MGYDLSTLACTLMVFRFTLLACTFENLEGMLARGKIILFLSHCLKH
jgi:hypothetical protein